MSKSASSDWAVSERGAFGWMARSRSRTTYRAKTRDVSTRWRVQAIRRNALRESIPGNYLSLEQRN